MKWREMKGNVELLDMCMCIVFAFQLIRAKEVRIDIEVERSEEKWREVMTCDVSPVAMFLYIVCAWYGPWVSVGDTTQWFQYFQEQITSRKGQSLVDLFDNADQWQQEKKSIIQSGQSGSVGRARQGIKEMESWPQNLYHSTWARDITRYSKIYI